MNIEDEQFNTDKTVLQKIPRRLLIVVNDINTSRQLNSSLEKAGYTVSYAKNVEEGISLLTNNVPDLIISDVDMPDISGIDFCIKIRENIKTAAVPFILLTDKKHVCDKIGGLKAGADDYISKPFEPSELLVRIEAKLERFKVLRDLINFDAFTNLYNRDYFDRRLKDILKISSRYNHKVSLVLIDIDYFKTFNDTYGHQAGDFVLKEVAKIIRDGLREVDTVARYGGDEFVAIMPETSKNNAEIAVERIKKELEQRPFSYNGESKDLYITISAGVATFPDEAQTDYDLVNKADLALYQEKRKNRSLCSAPLESRK
ncbi:diguanylate cyclase [bacterium]|nr:diguanylate cyclase [bacterium]